MKQYSRIAKLIMNKIAASQTSMKLKPLFGGASVELIEPYTLKVIKSNVINNPILPGTCHIFEIDKIFMKLVFFSRNTYNVWIDNKRCHRQEGKKSSW